MSTQDENRKRVMAEIALQAMNVVNRPTPGMVGRLIRRLEEVQAPERYNAGIIIGCWRDETLLTVVEERAGRLTVVAFAASDPPRAGQELCLFWVDPDYRERGLARQLLEAVLPTLIPPIQVQAVGASSGFWEHMGFTRLASGTRCTHELDT